MNSVYVNPKWRYAIGTTSIVPQTLRKRHYLILDVDDRDVIPAVQFLMDELRVRTFSLHATRRGWHVYTNFTMAFDELVYTLRAVPNVDQRWVDLGQRRRYFYLADRYLVDLGWPVVRMQIHHVQKT